MRRTRIYLLGTALAAAALAVSHAVAPRTVRAQDFTRLWVTSELGETCSGTCGPGKKCCRIVIVAPPPGP